MEASDVITVLQKGGVVIVPTDTVYGLVADASNKKAVEKIYKVKQRPKSKPLPIFIKDLEMAKKLAEINEKQEKIIRKKWPGKFTFVLKRKPGIKLYGVVKDTIALRVPNHPFLQNILEKIDKPLVQTSANISTQQPLHSAEEIMATFGKSKLVGLIVTSQGTWRGLPTQAGKSSKVIDLTGNKPNILRK